MSEKDHIQQYIEQFIKANQNTYTRDAITQRLIKAGYSIESIDQGFEALGINREIEPKLKNDQVMKQVDWRDAKPNPIGVLIFFPGVPVLMYALAFIEPGLIGWIYIGTIVAGLLVPRFIKHNNPGLAKGMIYGFRTYLVLFVCFPILAVAVLWGICMASGFNI